MPDYRLSPRRGLCTHCHVLDSEKELVESAIWAWFAKVAILATIMGAKLSRSQTSH